MNLFGDNEVKNEIKEEKIKKISLFDMLGDINYEKKHLLRNDSLFEKDIPIFMILNGLSQGVDTIMYANELNKNFDIPVYVQYDYLIHSIRSRKRYNKWAKKTNNKRIDNIIEYFNYSYDKALQVINILTEEQHNIIEENLKKGGTKR